MTDISKCSKIMIIGSPGSGKSYLSRALAEHTGLPVFHLDTQYWQPGWQKMPNEEWETRHKNIIQGEKWIIDGNYSSTIVPRARAAQLIIFLDAGLVLCISRVLRRHGKKREDLPEYLEEKFDREFLDFLKFTALFPFKNKKAIMKALLPFSEKLLVLKGKKSVDSFLEKATKQ